MTQPEEIKQAVAEAASDVVEQLTTPDEWAVQDLTPEEVAGLMQIAGSEGGLGSCQDSEDAGLGDDDHGLEGTDGSAEG